MNTTASPLRVSFTVPASDIGRAVSELDAAGIRFSFWGGPANFTVVSIWDHRHAATRIVGSAGTVETGTVH